MKLPARPTLESLHDSFNQAFKEIIHLHKIAFENEETRQNIAVVSEELKKLKERLNLIIRAADQYAKDTKTQFASVSNPSENSQHTTYINLAKYPAGSLAQMASQIGLFSKHRHDVIDPAQVATDTKPKDLSNADTTIEFKNN